MFFKRHEQTQTVMLNHGIPLLHMVPLTERRIKIETHLITEEEYLVKASNVTHAVFNDGFSFARKVYNKNRKK